MNFFKKIFSTSDKPKEDSNKLETNPNLPLDELFAHNFTKKKGKFLYCTSQDEINENLKNILVENNWNSLVCFDDDLDKLAFILNIDSSNKIDKTKAFFTNCEQLVAEDGSILFSSNQIKEIKLNELPENFIVFAKTSQILKEKKDVLTSINSKYKKEKPSNISAVKHYDTSKKLDNLMDYGNLNTKKLYLLLLEDL